MMKSNQNQKARMRILNSRGALKMETNQKVKNYQSTTFGQCNKNYIIIIYKCAEQIIK